MTARDDASLLDIATAAQRILEFTQDLSQTEFESDLKTQSAVLYQIAILGEAVKRLSQGFRSNHPNIPWASMAGMRDKLVHDYDGVDTRRVWLTINASIPELLNAIEPLLPTEDET